MWDDVFVENNIVWWIRDCVFEKECYVLNRVLGVILRGWWYVLYEKNRSYGVELCVRSGGKVWWVLDVTNLIKEVWRRE